MHFIRSENRISICAVIAYCVKVYECVFYPIKSCVCINYLLLCSSKQNLLEELDNLQADLTDLKFKNEEIKMSYQDSSSQVLYFLIISASRMQICL